MHDTYTAQSTFPIRARDRMTHLTSFGSDAFFGFLWAQVVDSAHMSSSSDAILEAAAVPRRKRRCLRSIASVPCEGPSQQTGVWHQRTLSLNFLASPRWMTACLVVLRWRLVLPPDPDPEGSLLCPVGGATSQARPPWSHVENSIHSRSAMALDALRGDPLERRGVGLARVVAARTESVACRSYLSSIELRITDVIVRSSSWADAISTHVVERCCLVVPLTCKRGCQRLSSCPSRRTQMRAKKNSPLEPIQPHCPSSLISPKTKLSYFTAEVSWDPVDILRLHARCLMPARPLGKRCGPASTSSY